MVIREDLLDIWDQVRVHLPPDFDIEETARERRAFLRKRNVDDVFTLFRLAMGYGGCGMSLDEVCAWAAALNIAVLSKPSLMERLCNAAPWLGHIVAALIDQQATVPAKRWAGYRLRALDATAICQPGADRTTWRLHVGYDLAKGQVDHIELTDGHGGENLQRVTYRSGEIVLADRIYAKARNLWLVKQDGADFVVRMGWNALCLKHHDGREFDLFATLRAQVGQQGEVSVRVDKGIEAPEGLKLRLIIWRKTPEQTEAEQKRLLKNAKKRGTTVDPRSLEAAGYVMLLTSLPADIFPACDVLAIYRFRWQIELNFKRMKSLGGLDELAAKKPELAKAWIYARLIAFLIAEQIAGQVPESPPSGSRKSHINRRSRGAHKRRKSSAKSFTLAHDQNGPCRYPRQHSRFTLAKDSRSPQANPAALY
jgi:Transposase DDE domain